MEHSRKDLDSRTDKTSWFKWWPYWFKVKRSFKRRFLYLTIAIMAILVIVLCHFFSVKCKSLCNEIYDAKTAANISALKQYLLNAENHTVIAATDMAANPKAVMAVKSQDRNKIIDVFSPTLEFYNITHYTICDKMGVVLARTLAPDQFGDPIGDRLYISEALQGRITTSFGHGTVDRVAAQTGAPVRDGNGAIIGAISAGVRFDTDKTIDELSKLLNAEVSVVFERTSPATTAVQKDGQKSAGMDLDPFIVEFAIESGHEQFGSANRLGKDNRAFSLSVLDSNKKTFASFVVREAVSDLSNKIDSLVRQGIYIGFVGLVISIALLTIVIAMLSKDITVLMEDMDEVAQGKLDISISPSRNDEVGRLAKSLRKVVGTISNLLHEINVMIAEHEKGNTHHRINVDTFHGEFKTLATNILKLSDMGIRDHLTGLPNRRAFDNRFELEWGRAKRDENSIGLLMLDLDHFKDYNDRFGHQQGDAALQETAHAILRVIKRRVDFVARWGGEEFAVLLPGTDLDGAMTVASQIREEVEKMAIPCTDTAAEHITISIGVNTQKPARHSPLSLLIATADEALYKAKQLGRNRVEVLQ